MELKIFIVAIALNALAYAAYKHVTLKQVEAKAKADIAELKNNITAMVTTIENLRKTQTLAASAPSRTVAVETATVNKTA